MTAPLLPRLRELAEKARSVAAAEAELDAELREAFPSLLAQIEAADRMRAAFTATVTHPCKASDTELADAIREYDAVKEGK